MWALCGCAISADSIWVLAVAVAFVMSGKSGGSGHECLARRFCRANRMNRVNRMDHVSRVNRVNRIIV